MDLNEYLAYLDDSIKYLYIFSLVVGVVYFQRLNSIVITALVLVGVEVFMNEIRDPLLAFILPWQNEWKLTVWTTVWSLCELGAILAINFLHIKIGVDTGIQARNVKLAYLALMAMQILLMINVYFFNSDFIAEAYSYGIPAINVSIGVYFLGSVMMVIRNEYFTDSSNSI